jgi:hypothetical protein
MITSKIAANQTFAQIVRPQRPEAGEAAGEGSGDQVRTTRGEMIDGIKTDLSPFGANRWQNFNAEFNAVVRSIRIADQAMGEIESHLERMADEVATYVKRYPPYQSPPYPRESAERAELLNNFAGLRKLADRLSVAPDAHARQIIGAQGEASGESDWQVRVGGKDLGVTIHRQPVHSGKEGLDLPELAESADDREIAALGKVLDQALTTVRSRRAELADDAVNAIREAEKNL